MSIVDGSKNARRPVSSGHQARISNLLSERSCQITFVELVRSQRQRSKSAPRERAEEVHSVFSWAMERWEDPEEAAVRLSDG